MPVGATVGAAVIGGGAQLAGASKQSKAAKQSAAMAAQSNTENNAVAREFYAKNQANLNPWMQQGLAANQLVNSALGIPSYTAPQPAAFAQYAQPQSYGNPQASAFAGQEAGFQQNMQSDYGNPMQAMQYGAPAPVPGQMQTTAAPPNPRSAFDIFRNSTGYNFRMGEGVNALQKAFGRNLDSGAAVKSALRFGQGIASDEFGKWLGAIGNQQQLGYGAASALAGVNQNMANTLAQNNNSSTSAAINARLYGANASANAWQGVGSSFGQAAGQYAQMQNQKNMMQPMQRDQYGVSPWLYSG